MNRFAPPFLAMALLAATMLAGVAQAKVINVAPGGDAQEFVSAAKHFGQV